MAKRIDGNEKRNNYQIEKIRTPMVKKKVLLYNDNGDIIFLMEKGKVKVENKMRTSKKWTDG